MTAAGRRHRGIGVVAASLVLAAIPAARAADDGSVTLGIGAEYTTGDYGGGASVDEVYVPVTGHYDTGRFAFRLTVPFLQVRAPLGTVTEGPGGEIIVGEGPRTTESGLGDVIAALTVYDVLTGSGGDFAIDLTGRVKLGTADEDKGLGTGESDYSLQADVYRFFDRLTLAGSVGYTVRGDPDGLDLDNALFVSFGGAWNASAKTRVAIFYDYRQASLAGNDDPQELSLSASWRMSPAWTLRCYAAAGLTDASPDAGAGVVFNRDF